ncbi:MAG: hypothetical protein HYW01_06305 [Deltaproteobacteria bacterium]|nr:hypothetical protein [Deltaproteobacteria bacterium]
MIRYSFLLVFIIVFGSLDLAQSKTFNQVLAINKTNNSVTLDFGQKVGVFSFGAEFDNEEKRREGGIILFWSVDGRSFCSIESLKIERIGDSKTMTLPTISYKEHKIEGMDSNNIWISGKRFQFNKNISTCKNYKKGDALIFIDIFDNYWSEPDKVPECAFTVWNLDKSSVCALECELNK